MYNIFEATIIYLIVVNEKYSCNMLDAALAPLASAEGGDPV